MPSTTAIAKPPKLPGDIRVRAAELIDIPRGDRRAVDAARPVRAAGRSQLKEAKVAETFIAAARKVLEMRATDYVGFSVDHQQRCS